jgi:diaminohydroxyphosphoribosylaminopyrimidine deaminase/5-amino-6-(5-phosphoribosylamino)uracil reductase
MLRAIELAERGRFSVSPNPMVGCVIVKDGAIIGEGWHERAGLPHAEVIALQSCRSSPVGATAYVSLEPCSHYGRTPPCTNALIAARVKRVVVAIADPHAVVNGTGIELLRRAGIEVSTGLCEREAAKQNEKFLFAMREHTPFVLLKAGMTLDGKLATVRRRSQWITSEEARRRSLLIREEYDAILVGSGTVIADDPQLTRRLGMNSSIVPWTRVIVDGSGEVPPGARVLNDGLPSLLFTPAPERFENVSADVIRMQSHDGQLDLRHVLTALFDRGIHSLVAEGGSLIHSELIREKLWQKMALFVAPMIVGGSTAPSIFSGEGVEELPDAFRFRFDSVEPVGPDILVTAYPE